MRRSAILAVSLLLAGCATAPRQTEQAQPAPPPPSQHTRGQIMGLSSGFMKMIFALDTRRLLGVHIVGEGATELIHIGQAVINLGGTVDFFVNNTFNYPTLAEAYKIAGLDAWNRMGNG